MRITKHRQEILDTLSAADGTLSVAAIHTALPHINLVTIYRNVEAFTEAGTIKKLHIGGNEAVYELQAVPHHHAICTDCDRVMHFTADPKKLKRALGLQGFDINDIDIIVRGHCHKVL